ncbi:uncharacterized protein PODANS_1_12810 [Podospora anserina S mat+]|uniref:Podospora anserina S mat+ genomic DNA chromosome 1, supercontig 2 n=1 Tax=Podospora anserina (strain S / ATCC MYA-4624 / DSM 980 / FGSC 10383) TaxID=515849 RepID=B2AZ01_PODAN|nr:uncharacterized protein PODANS_1_12810 [Podospora anserina S mat+]CAP69625.1 unnamed protein product [Podospora anserina S mat+]CDP23641.1 Putative protein of unknown function [Podospora anserina S mat+]
MATAETVELGATHEPKEESLRVFEQIEHELKKTLVHIRHEHDKHEPEYFAATEHLSDAELAGFTLTTSSKFVSPSPHTGFISSAKSGFPLCLMMAQPTFISVLSPEARTTKPSSTVSIPKTRKNPMVATLSAPSSQKTIRWSAIKQATFCPLF